MDAKEPTATDLACLLDAGEGAVVTLVAGETRLVAHRAVLVDRSPIFDAMFRHDMLEARSGEVTIADVEGPALRQMLAFLYTLQDSKLSDMAPQLLVAADKYGVSDLKARCEQQVAEQLSVETAVDALFLAIRHCCPSLRQAVVAYIKAHQAEVMATQGWDDAVSMQPEDVDEVRKLLSETSSATPADSGTSQTLPPGHTVDTATTTGPRCWSPPCWPREHPTRLPGPMTPQSLACESSTMEAKETTAVDLGALLDACDDAVVTLVAGETRLVAHSSVLKDRCPKFSAMFRQDSPESGSGQVTIADVEGPVLRQLVSYLYTLQAPQLPGMAAKLLAAADRYGVESLMAACEQQVAAHLSVETAADAVLLALNHGCESLRQASLNFLMNNTHRVMASRGWADAKRRQPGDLMQVIWMLIDEFRSLPEMVKNWRLIEAAKQGAVGELNALLDAGADVAAIDANGSWMTPLHVAALWGRVGAVRRLIARGAPVDATDRGHQTPLHLAAGRGHADVVRLLLAASADHSAMDDRGWTPLHCAALRGNTEIAGALLEAGAESWVTDQWGQTPGDIARRWNHQQMDDLL